MRWLVPFLDVWCFIIDPILWLLGRRRRKAKERAEANAESGKPK
jgi:hypothetical protein